jgi:hypothetical protein
METRWDAVEPEHPDAHSERQSEHNNYDAEPVCH